MISAWLLPNRIYEGCRYGTVPIAIEGTETARFIAGRDIGFVLKDASVEGLVALSTARVSLASERGLRREGEQPDLYGSAHALEKDTGWTPSLPLSRSLQDTLDWWRARAADEEVDCPAR